MTVKGFTFQYVSINTKVKFKAACASGHLHSNMFLLIPIRFSLSLLYSSFTFQYVSINTQLAIDEQAKEFRFTFQYVSINTESIKENFGPDAHLHSNMFLLIPTAHQREVLDLQNLHSNMFLLIQKQR